MKMYMFWILHWLGQGLKLCLFMLIASFAFFAVGLLLAGVESMTGPFRELLLPMKVLVVAVHVICNAVGLAAFTALLASQLKDHPLRPLKRRG